MTARADASDRTSRARPVCSMTGFGTASGRDEQFEIRIEIRAVNHRHLAWKGAWPQLMQSLDALADAAIRRRVTRGNLSISFGLEHLQGRARVRFDSRLARAYLTDLQQLVREIGISEPPSLSFVLGLPGVVDAAEAVPSAEDLRSLFLDVLDRALLDLVASRTREGQALLQDLDARIGEIESHLAVIAQRWPRVVADYRARLEQRVREYLAERGQTIDDVEIVREVAIFADRSDVAEELARLKSHLEEARRIVAGGGAIGRALEFLSQEMLREANTIGSKSSDADLAHTVVAIKSALDRVKEQVQNLE